MLKTPDQTSVHMIKYTAIDIMQSIIGEQTMIDKRIKLSLYSPLEFDFHESSTWNSWWQLAVLL